MKIKSINFLTHPVHYSEVEVDFRTGYDHPEVGLPSTIIDSNKLRWSYIKNSKWQPNKSIRVMRANLAYWHQSDVGNAVVSRILNVTRFCLEFICGAFFFIGNYFISWYKRCFSTALFKLSMILTSEYAEYMLHDMLENLF